MVYFRYVSDERHSMKIVFEWRGWKVNIDRKS